MRDSSGSQHVEELLNKYSIRYQKEVPLTRRFKADFAIFIPGKLSPSYVIEFDGRQHRLDSKQFMYDLEKDLYCRKSNIKMIRIDGSNPDWTFFEQYLIKLVETVPSIVTEEKVEHIRTRTLDLNTIQLEDLQQPFYTLNELSNLISRSKSYILSEYITNLHLIQNWSGKSNLTKADFQLAREDLLRFLTSQEILYSGYKQLDFTSPEIIAEVGDLTVPLKTLIIVGRDLETPDLVEFANGILKGGVNLGKITRMVYPTQTFTALAREIKTMKYARVIVIGVNSSTKRELKYIADELGVAFGLN